MDTGTQEEVSQAKRPTWEEWYNQETGNIKYDLGQLEQAISDKGEEVIPSVTWIKSAYQHQLILLEVLNNTWKWLGRLQHATDELEVCVDEILQKKLPAFEERIGTRVGTLDRRLDNELNEIGNILSLLLQWKKRYQRVLDEAEKDYGDKQRRIARP
jgi:hypothetical protein